MKNVLIPTDLTNYTLNTIKFVLDTSATNALVKTSSIPILALNQKTACRIM